jgi:sec-independent protein translocase protein TatC
VLAIVTVGAVITPSGDPLTLLLLSVPLYLLYEIDIWLARFLLRR